MLPLVFVPKGKLHDRNPALYFATISAKPSMLLPAVYTPTVGEACQKFGKMPMRLALLVPPCHSEVQPRLLPADLGAGALQRSAAGVRRGGAGEGRRGAVPMCLGPFIVGHRMLS